MIEVGYWKEHSKCTLPMPEPGEWDEEEKALVLHHLKNVYMQERRFKGWSTCRICGCLNGSSDRHDGKYRWPSGLAHYVEEHNIVLPREFVVHILEVAGTKNVLQKF